MDQIANNLANVNTAGFKGETMLFTDYVARIRTDRSAFRDSVAFTEDFGAVRDLNEGAFTPTGNSLDVAIHGDGYFMVEAEDGSRFYTRNGHFKVNADGQMATTSGEILLSQAEQPVILAPTESEISIASDGTVSTENGVIGRLMVVNFANPRGLKRAGNGLYDAGDQTADPVARARISQGVLEGSNVQPITEMTRMIDVQRAYEASLKMIESEHSRINRAIEAFSKV